MNKRLQLLFVALSTVGIVSAQQNSNANAGTKYEAVKVSGERVVNGDRYGWHSVPQNANNNNNPVTAPAARSSRSASIGNQTGSTAVIGDTKYDLQSNASIDDRLTVHNDGTVSAAFTFSNAAGPTFTTRGTGYNYYNGSAWGAKPTSRIESERIGWPSLVFPVGVAGSGEVVISHSTDNDQLHLAHRASKGTGSWTEVQDPANSKTSGSGRYMVWPRATAGGPNGKTIHMIAVTEPTGGDFSGTLYQGMDGALLYSRSTNGGITWDIVDSLIPHIDNSLYSGVGADIYAIDAKGSTVSIAIFQRFGDVVMLKSNDNGLTWDKHTIVDFPYDNFTFEDRALDTTITSDGAGDVIIDNNGKVHVFYGSWRFYDDDTTDQVYTTQPYLNGLNYWNEDMPENQPTRIAEMEDIQAGLPAITSLADYGSKSICSFPSAGIDANGDIYLTYQGVREDLSDGSAQYSHIYGMKTPDGGCTWNTPVDLTNLGTGFEECAYSSVARRVDANLHFIYQEDLNAGTNVGPQAHAEVTNEIVYTAVPVATFNTPAYACNTWIEKSGELCAPDSIMLTASCGQSYAWSNGATSNSIWVSSYGTYSVDITTACGVITETIDVTAPTTGPVITPTSDFAAICATGGKAVITVPDAGSSSTYRWNNGSPTQIDTFAVNTPGTYTVEVTNCGGTTTASITIAQLQNIDAEISGRAFLCPGETTTLSGPEFQGATYVWSDGISQLGTSKDLQVNSTGTIYLNVSACGGSLNDQDTVTVTVEPSPSISIAGLNNILTSCVGDLPVQLEPQGLQTGAIVRWFKGSFANEVTAGSSNELLLSDTAESGTYFAYSYNSCGDSVKSNDLVVDISPRPAAPSITFNQSTVILTASGTGTFTWYVENTPVPGVTGNTLDPVDKKVNTGLRIYASVKQPGSDCESERSAPFYFNWVSVGENDNLTGINMFPNPTNGVFNIRSMDVNETVEVEVRNLAGQLIASKTIESNSTTSLDLSDNAKGVYLVSFKGNEIRGTKRLIIE